jgi:hypothetical protein
MATAQAANRKKARGRRIIDGIQIRDGIEHFGIGRRNFNFMTVSMRHFPCRRASFRSLLIARETEGLRSSPRAANVKTVLFQNGTVL